MSKKRDHSPQPEIVSSVERHAGEHEVFLQFNADDDAVLWHEWWNLHGCHEFEAFVENTREGRAT